MFCFLPFIFTFFILLKRWTSMMFYTQSFGKSFDCRRTSLCVSAKKSRLKIFSMLPKLVLCLAVIFLGSETSKRVIKITDTCKTLKNQQLFTLESLLAGNILREVESRQYFSLYALSKTKHTSHRSFFKFLIILSGDVNLNPLGTHVLHA